ncbi:MAG TPA: hypothetical protein VII73_03105 [Caulobacteraceae bacterium]
MTRNTALRGGAALSVLLMAAMGAPAEAKAAHHRHRALAAQESSSQGALRDEVRELKAQVDALQTWRESQAASQAQSDAQLQQVRAQLADTQAREQAAEAQLQTRIQTIPGDVRTAVAAAAPRTDKLYVKGVTLTLGGFVEAASIYRSNNMEADIASNFNAIPYGANAVGHTHELRFTARQSRITALVQGDVNPTIHLAGYGEFDFQSAAQTANSNQTNSYNPRIRQLYTTIDWDTEGGGWHFLAGQNWSLAVMNTKGITPRNELTPPQIDAQYVPGFVFTRQPQFRVAYDWDKHLWVALSLENPQTTFFTSGKYNAGVSPLISGPAGSGFNAANTLSLNHVPDVIGKVALEENLSGHSLHLEAFGIYRDLYERLNSSGTIANNDTAAGGVGGGAVLAVVPKVLDVQVSALYGAGIGRYGAAGLPDATLGVDGTLHPIRELDLLAGATWHVNPKLDLYAFAGEEREEETAFTAGTVFNGLGNPNYVNSGCATEGSSACVGATRYIDQATVGFWHKPYQGAFGRFQWGVQYSYTERHAFAGVGGAPSASENTLFTSFRYYPF